MLTDAIGFLASFLVLTTFCMHSMVLLRLIAIASNMAFMAYGFMADLPPVVALHATLLPLNIWFVFQMIPGYRRRILPS